MLKRIKTAIWLLFLLSSFSAPTNAMEWAKRYGDVGWGSQSFSSVEQAADGGYIAAGWKGPAAWVIKLADNGTIVWQKTYGTENQFPAIYSIRKTPEGGYIATGAILSSDSSHNIACVLKLNNDGSIAWQKRYSIPNQRFGLTYIERTADGGYIVAGRIHYGSFQDATVLKLNYDGSIDWQRRYCINNQASSISSIQQTSDGGYVMAGSIWTPADPSRAFVLKIKSEGTIDWLMRYDGGGYESISHIQQTSDGGYVAVGEYMPNNATQYASVAKLNSNGTVAWRKTYGSANWQSYASSVQKASDGGYMIAGSILSTSSLHAWILNLNTDGTIKRQKAYYGTSAFSLRQTSAGGYIVSIKNSVPSGYIGVMKLDAYGDIYGCSLVGVQPSVDVNDTAMIVRATTAVVSDPYISLPTPSMATIADTDATETTLCVSAALGLPTVPFQWEEWLKNRIRCLDWSDGVGVGSPGRCQPRGCIMCRFRFSQYKIPENIPSYLHELYEVTNPLLLQETYNKIPEITAKRILKLFDTIPVESYFTGTLKRALTNELKNESLTPGIRNILAQSINAVELDLGVPRLKPEAVVAGKYSAVDLQGVSWLTFRNIRKKGKVSLKIVNGLPASVPGFTPAWPVSSYHFDFTGILDKDGYVDIGIYIGGLQLLGQMSDLRIFEWDGKSYRDITTDVDLQRGIITCRTNSLFTYVIMSPEYDNKVACEKCSR